MFLFHHSLRDLPGDAPEFSAPARLRRGDEHIASGVKRLSPVERDLLKVGVALPQ